MEEFKQLVEEVELAKTYADKFYIKENMLAGKRYFASLMNIQRMCKSARIELSAQRKIVREKRQLSNGGH